jgi:hypothetical protein
VNKRYVILHGALWELSEDRFEELLECVATNIPYNLLDYGIKLGVGIIDLTTITPAKGKNALLSYRHRNNRVG